MHKNATQGDIGCTSNGFQLPDVQVKHLGNFIQAHPPSTARFVVGVQNKKVSTVVEIEVKIARHIQTVRCNCQFKIISLLNGLTFT
jgi:hypothetical protein